jgi:hypothetical protein
MPICATPLSGHRFAPKPLRWSALGAETWNVMLDVVHAVETSTSPEEYQSKTSATRRSRRPRTGRGTST